LTIFAAPQTLYSVGERDTPFSILAPSALSCCGPNAKSDYVPAVSLMNQHIMIMVMCTWPILLPSVSVELWRKMRYEKFVKKLACTSV